MTLLVLLGRFLSPGPDVSSLSQVPSASEQDPVQEEATAPVPGVPGVAADATDAQDEATEQEESVVQAALEGDESLTPDLDGSLSGYLNLRTRSRWADDGGDDHDMYVVAAVDYITPGVSSWGLHVLAQGLWGIDSQSPDSVFFSINDTYDDQLYARVYRAYADAPTVDGLSMARLGRMMIYDTPTWAYFDGAQLETEPIGPTQVVVGAYGGLSVHLDENQLSDQHVGGVYTRFRPWVDGLLRFDWMSLDDDPRYGNGRNDLVSAGLTHRIGKEIRLEGNYSQLDGERNDMRLKGLWLLPDEQMTVRFSYYSLLRAQSNLAYELNPYYNILKTYFPYDQTQLTVSKAFGDTVELFGGLDTRRVDDQADIARYNRDFDRFYLTSAFSDLLPWDTTVSLTGEIWDSPDNDMQTWGIDLTSQATENTKASIGSYYSLYKYYFDTDREREDVRTFFAELRNHACESASVMIRYEFEDEEIDSFHNLRLGVTWRF